jgi:hypothetical protein
VNEEMTSNSIIGNVRISPYPLHVELLQAAYASKNIKTIGKDALLDIPPWVSACLAFEV